MQTKYYPREEAAEYVRTTWGLPCAKNTLAKLACVGGGPRFYKAGRTPLYAPIDLDNWAQARLSKRSYGSNADATVAGAR